MSLRLIAFGFASALLLISGAPAFADDASVLDNRQENVTTGNGNDSRNQNLQDSSIDSRRGNTGTSMRNNQLNDTVGDNNTSINVNGQKSRRIRR
jgi:hypothetical protein